MTTRGKGKKLNKACLHDHLTDPYVKLAQREGYRARAAYKLKEIDEQLHLLAPGQLVVDLGAAPGAWSQYVRRKFGRSAGATDPAAPPGPLHGAIVALDLLEFEPIDGVDGVFGDFREQAVLDALEAKLAGYSQLVERFKTSFRVVKAIKPKASRAKSAETFLVGIGPKPAASGTDLRA